MASLRYTLPGHIMRIGGCECSITRACTLDVCERSSIFFVTSLGCWLTKNVSCMSRAGWSAAKFILVNTCWSSSTSGPSARTNPMREKMSIISFLTIVRGCLVPNSIGYAVRVRSMSSLPVSAVCSCSRSSLMWLRAVCFSSLILMPTAFF